MSDGEFVVGAALVMPLTSPPSLASLRGDFADPRAFRDLYPYALAASYQLASKLGDDRNKEKGVTPAN